MINFQTFVFGLLTTSILTGLVTEGVKIVMTENGKKYAANTIAGIIAIILSAAIGVAYVLFTGITFSTQTIISILALILLSWLCAMVGYDKVVQAFAQIKTYREGEQR